VSKARRNDAAVWPDLTYDWPCSLSPNFVEFLIRNGSNRPPGSALVCRSIFSSKLTLEVVHSGAEGNRASKGSVVADPCVVVIRFDRIRCDVTDKRGGYVRLYGTDAPVADRFFAGNVVQNPVAYCGASYTKVSLREVILLFGQIVVDRIGADC